MASRDEIVSFLDELLESPGFPDYGPNGLQVPGGERVELVVTGVSAHLELFERAADVADGPTLVASHAAGELEPERAGRVGSHEGRAVGFVGRSTEGIPLDDLRARCASAFGGREPLIQGDGPEVVRSVAVISGALVV